MQSLFETLVSKGAASFFLFPNQSPNQLSMKKSMYLLLSVLFVQALNAQIPAPPPPPPPPSLENSTDIYVVVEEMPTFPGCEGINDRDEKKNCSDEKIHDYIYDNLQYPSIASENGVEGIVIVKFVVEKDGSIEEAKIVRDIGANCGMEAMRLVNAMPKWTPGRQRGFLVRVQSEVTVRFKLKDGKKYKPTFTPAKPNLQVVELAPPPPPPPVKKEEPDSSDEIYKVVEEQPFFQGCNGYQDPVEEKKCSQEKLVEFVYSNLKYPEQAKAKGIQGTVYTKFIIEKDGSITKPEIVRDIGGGCGEEAIRIINLMPTWNPGKQNGKMVRVQFNMPVKFKLD